MPRLRRSLRAGIDVARNGPEECSDLACDRGDYDGDALAPCGEAPIPGAQAYLRLPSDIADPLRKVPLPGLVLVA